MEEIIEETMEDTIDDTVGENSNANFDEAIGNDDISDTADCMKEDIFVAKGLAKERVILKNGTFLTPASFTNPGKTSDYAQISFIAQV